MKNKKNKKKLKKPIPLRRKNVHSQKFHKLGIEGCECLLITEVENFQCPLLEIKLNRTVKTMYAFPLKFFN